MCVKEDVAKPNLESSSRWKKITGIGPKNVWNANTPCVWIVTRNTKVATWPNEGFKRMLQGGPLTTNGDVRLVPSRNENENDLGRLLSTFFSDLIGFVEQYYLHSCGFCNAAYFGSFDGTIFWPLFLHTKFWRSSRRTWQHDAEADQKKAVTESTYHVTNFKAQPNSFWPFEKMGS